MGDSPVHFDIEISMAGSEGLVGMKVDDTRSTWPAQKVWDGMKVDNREIVRDVTERQFHCWRQMLSLRESSVPSNFHGRRSQRIPRHFSPEQHEV